VESSEVTDSHHYVGRIIEALYDDRSSVRGQLKDKEIKVDPDADPKPETEAES
jgi:hypothetical protein